MDQISLLSFKIVAAICIFFLTLTAGILPIKYAKKHVHLFCLGDAFASGVFLSAALLHLLPDACEDFRKILGDDCYPFAQLITIGVFVFMMLLERGVAVYGKRHEQEKHTITAILLIVALTIHSIVEGTAIGINGSLAGATVIFFAVIAHKGSESFALAASLHRYLFTEKRIIKIIAFFACMTPLGILVASLISQMLHTNAGGMLEAVFNSIAAGTFLYIGTEHMIEGAESYEGFGQIISMALGITLMAVVAIWV